MDSINILTVVWWTLLALYIPACFGLMVIVLLQKGKGVGFGGAFGIGGGGEAIFGPRTSRSLPQKLTYTMAGMFMVLALLMSTLSSKANRGPAPELEADATIGSVTQEEINDLLDPNAPAVKPGEPAAEDAAAGQTAQPGETMLNTPIGEVPMSVEVTPGTEPSADGGADSPEGVVANPLILMPENLPADESAPASPEAPADAPEAATPEADTSAETPAPEASADVAPAAETPAAEAAPAVETPAAEAAPAGGEPAQ